MKSVIQNENIVVAACRKYGIEDSNLLDEEDSQCLEEDNTEQASTGSSILEDLEADGTKITFTIE